jgi:hypothetical protein
VTLLLICDVTALISCGEETCTEPAQLQCFSAFDASTSSTSRTSTGSGSDTSEDSASDCGDSQHNLLSQTWFVATMLGCVAALSLTVGALLGGYSLTLRGEEARHRVNPADIDQTFLLGEM